jgi:ribosome-associated toxin RatA of RatAB toxin-antitoxin module
MRGFLPGLGQLLKKSEGEGMRRTQRWQRIVPHRTATMFRAVSAVEEYASFLPWCISSHVMNRSVDEPSGVEHLETEISVGFQTLRSKFSSRVQITPMTRVHAESDANEYMEHLSFTWDFGSLGDKSCRLDLMLGACPAPACRHGLSATQRHSSAGVQRLRSDGMHPCARGRCVRPQTLPCEILSISCCGTSRTIRSSRSTCVASASGASPSKLRSNDTVAAQ